MSIYQSDQELANTDDNGNRLEDRKHYHNLEAELSKDQENEERPNICPHCHKGMLIPKGSFDPANDDVYFYAQCDNPDCQATVS